MANKFNRLIINNIDEVNKFITINIPDVKLQSNGRPLVNCPYCDSGKHRHKLIVNTEWNNFKCYRCNESGSIFKLIKEFNLYDEFIELLSSLSNTSLLEIKNQINENNEEKEAICNIENNDIISKFKKENLISNIDDYPIAKKYAIERTLNDKEVETYLADNKYIYVPITFETEIISYMGRLYNYNEFPKAPRYNVKYINNSKPMIGFYDKVVNNLNTDKIYITEGYFDSLSINHCLNNDVSMALFGKNNYKSVFNQLIKVMPSNIDVYIVLDSVEKDNNIIKSNKDVAEYASQFFDKVYIVELEDGDCNEIASHSLFELKSQLETNICSLFKYKLKYI